MNINNKLNKVNLFLKNILFSFFIILICICLFTIVFTNRNTITTYPLSKTSSELDDSSNSSNTFFTITSHELTSKINEYNKYKKIELSSDELIYYSSLSYEERLDFLFDNRYLLSNRIEVFLGDDIDNFGLVYYDLSTDEKVSINEDLKFTAASTYKVGLNLLFYYLASQGEINLNDYISYKSTDYEEGTGILYTKSSIGSYTIQELLDLSIIYSDNIATNMLGRYLGGHAVVRQKLYDLLNIDFSSKGNYITANIEFLILKYIYDNKNDSNFAHLIDTLANTLFHDRLDRYVPTEIVAHKVGNYGSYIHDVGIILSDSPYILAIYTYNIDNAEEKIAQISKAIYENQLPIY